VSVVSITGCSWTINNTNSWVTITSATNGSGSDTVSYSIASNTTSSARVAFITIAGQTFTINQADAPCLFTLSPTNKVHGFISETNSFNVTNVSSCAWIAVNTNSWITITSATNGTGNGAITYTVTANPTLTNRSGVIRVSGREFTISQVGALCSYAITPSGNSH